MSRISIPADLSPDGSMRGVISTAAVWMIDLVDVPEWNYHGDGTVTAIHEIVVNGRRVAVQTRRLDVDENLHPIVVGTPIYLLYTEICQYL